MKVYDYDVDGSRHCREGVATEENDAMFDTFWGSGGDRHRLSNAERGSARLRFDTDEFEEIALYHRGTPAKWAERHPNDRETLPSQHGLTIRWFIRKGSTPDYATRLSNAVEALEDAESKLRAAESAVRWAREGVEKIAAEAVEIDAPERQATVD